MQGRSVSGTLDASIVDREDGGIYLHLLGRMSLPMEMISSRLGTMDNAEVSSFHISQQLLCRNFCVLDLTEVSTQCLARFCLL